MTANSKPNNYTKSERDMLKTFRYFLFAFSEGSQTHWETAMGISKGEHGLESGRHIGFVMLRVLQAVREARSDPFLFINPGCEKCAHSILDCERYLMDAIKCVFDGDVSAARISMLLLCEGTDPKAVMVAIQELSDQLNIQTETGEVSKFISNFISR